MDFFLSVCYTGSRGNQTEFRMFFSFLLRSFDLMSSRKLGAVGQGRCILRCRESVSSRVWVNLGHNLKQTIKHRYIEGTYLLSVAPVFCHHFPQCLKYFDAQTFLILLQQLLGVFNQSGQGKRGKKDAYIHKNGLMKAAAEHTITSFRLTTHYFGCFFHYSVVTV